MLYLWIEIINCPQHLQLMKIYLQSSIIGWSGRRCAHVSNLTILIKYILLNYLIIWQIQNIIALSVISWFTLLLIVFQWFIWCHRYSWWLPKQLGQTSVEVSVLTFEMGNLKWQNACSAALGPIMWLENCKVFMTWKLSVPVLRNQYKSSKIALTPHNW